MSEMSSTTIAPDYQWQERSYKLQLSFQQSPLHRAYIAHQYVEYPFHITRPFYLNPTAPHLATVYLQSASGGIVQGDRLSLNLQVGPAAAVQFTTQSGTKVHQMQGRSATQTTQLVVQAGGYLEYLMDPLILFPASQLQSSTIAQVADTATLILSEAFTSHNPTGDPDPAFDRFESELRIERSPGKLLVLDRLHLDSQQRGMGIVGVAAHYKAQASVMVISDRPQLAERLRDRLTRLQSDHPDLYLGLSTLPQECGVWIRVLAVDSGPLKRALQHCWAACRWAVTGYSWVPLRK
jgi:urease accessory protein